MNETKQEQQGPDMGMTPGLQTGIVRRPAPDPEGEYRVMVDIPDLGISSVWARLGNLAATSSAGTFFYPETGDEVILGFIGNDPASPVILGSLYGKKNVPAYTPEERNQTKAIISRNQVKIVIDEEKKSITVVTPGLNSVVLSDDAKSIVMADQNGNKIALSPSGITLESAKDITIKTTGDLNITGQNTILNATGSLGISGTNIDINSTRELSLKGTAAAELSASGEVKIQGAMVMIN